MKKKWTTTDIPNQAGKVAIVTGANSGIGYETAKALAEKEAIVIMACRNLEKANAAANDIRRASPDGPVEVIQLDLGDLESVRQFAEDFLGRYGRLDYLINNAGIMVPPYGKTTQGFETQFGVNHLGHFALTGHLMNLILASPQARIVNVSSNMHRMGSGTIDFENLNAEKGYKAAAAYSQSKLANLLFTLELSRRLKAIDADTLAVASHPGWTVTNLQKGFTHFISRLVGQSAEMGALPSLYAATAPDVQPNDYYGPGGLKEIRGHPQKVDRSSAAKDAELARKLWAVSEELTAVHYL